MATLREALEYAKNNPTSDFARELEVGIKSGAYNKIGEQEGIDLVPFNSTKTQEGNRGIPGVLAGVSKSVAKNVLGGADLVYKGAKTMASQIAGPVVAEAIAPAVEKGIESAESKIKDATGSTPGEFFDKAREDLKAVTPAEKLGSTLGDIASFVSGAEVAQGLTKGANIATRIGGQVASDVAISTAQEGNSKGAGKEAITSGVLSSVPLFGRLLGKSFGKIAEKGAKSLEEINLRLSPKDKLKIAKDEGEVVDYLTKKKLTGSPEKRLEKIEELYNTKENEIQSVLKSNKAPEYDKTAVISVIQDVPKKYSQEFSNPEVFRQLENQSESLIDFLNKNFGDKIPASRLNEFKREYFKNAFNSAGDAVTNEARLSLGREIYDVLLKDIPEMKGLNSEYQKIIKSRRLLGNALGRNQLGIIGKIVSSIGTAGLGGAVGGPVGGALGAVIGPSAGTAIAGTTVRSNIGSGLQKFSEYIANAKPDEAGNFIIPRSIINGLINDNTD